MKHMTLYMLVLFLLFSGVHTSLYSENIAPYAINKKVHDFGIIYTTDGPQRCTCHIKNISNHPFSIISVNTSCGCTQATWSKKPLCPQETREIDILYKNNEGPYPFENEITVQLSNTKSPIHLSVKGVVRKRRVEPKKDFVYKIGRIGIRNRVFKRKTQIQGAMVYDSFPVYNFAKDTFFLRLNSSAIINSRYKKLPPKTTCYVKYHLKIPMELGDTLLPVNVQIFDDKKTIQHCENVFIDLQIGCNNDTIRERSSLRIEPSHISLGEISEHTKKSFNVIFWNDSMTPLTIYKIDTPSYLTMNQYPKNIYYRQNQTIQFQLDGSKLSNSDGIAIITVFSNNRETKEHIYVTFEKKTILADLYTRIVQYIKQIISSLKELFYL